MSLVARGCWALPLACLIAGFPVVARSAGEPAQAPASDLERITLSDLGATATKPGGGSVRLTLDPTLQRAAQKLLAGAEPVAGGLIAIDAHSGRVLAWAELERDGHPRHLLTRARMPAASVFKIVTTAALFETTSVTPADPVCIAGGLHGIERRHLDAPQGGEAIECAPFRYALGYSKNAVYAQLATHRLRRDDLLGTAEALGFNGRVPFDGEAEMGRLALPYNDLEFARAAAGFQGSTLSPLGAAHLANVIAHGGEATRIRIFEDGRDPDALAESVARVLHPLTAERIRHMMEVTVRSGTCRHAFSDDDGRPYLGNIRVAGKTGTLKPGSSEGLTSWFIGFAPSRSPEVVVSVMLENGKVWRRKANELARDFLRVYLRKAGRSWLSDPFEREPSKRPSEELVSAR
ncbi:MAG TPA: penicillin-binding transpeptidase domain-containing protein [Polyangiaceae bacterium]|jgi:cell division protein FtsI/penicillin-binding protein 2